MSTVRLVRTLSGSANSSLSDSINSLQFARQGSSSSHFTVTDTRKCSTGHSSLQRHGSKRRDSECPLPPMKPEDPQALHQEAVDDWERGHVQPEPMFRKSNQQAEEAQSALFEMCYEEEEEEASDSADSTPYPSDSSAGSTTCPSITDRMVTERLVYRSFCISSAHSSMSQLLRGFRPDLDEQVQKRLITEYHKERHAAWVELHPGASSKNSEDSKWAKRQQALSLSFLVVEASNQMHKLVAKNRNKVPPPVEINSAPSRARPPATQNSPAIQNIAMLLHDILILIDNNEEDVDRYENVRAQIHGLHLWNL